MSLRFLDPPKAPIKFTSEDSSSVLWACGVCGTVFYRGTLLRQQEDSQQIATRCCSVRMCEVHNIEVEKNSRCRTCQRNQRKTRLRDRFDKAEKLSEGEWGGPVVLPLDDRYYENIGELREIFETNEWDLPEWVHPCDVVPLRVSAENIETMIDNVLEDGPENAEFLFCEEVFAFFIDWNKKQVYQRWQDDFNRVVVLDKEIS